MEATFNGNILEGAELQTFLDQDPHPLNGQIGKVTLIELSSQSMLCEILTVEEHAVVNFARPIDPSTYVTGTGYIQAFRKTRDELWAAVAYRAKLEQDPKIVSKLIAHKE